MDSKIIYGKFKFRDKSYPFIIQNNIMSVVQQAFEYNQDFWGIEELGNLWGITSSNRYIILLNCRRLGSNTLSNQLHFSLHGYIIQDNKDDCYDRLTFYSKALNAFFPPRQAWDMQSNDPYSFSGVTIKSPDEVQKSVEISFSTETIQCDLGFYYNLNLREIENDTLSFRPQFSMQFAQPKTSYEIGKYYLYLRDFLAFANFRNDIPIDDILLFRKDENGRLRKIGKAVMFQHDYSEYTPDIRTSITFADIGIDALPALFAEIATQREQKNFNPYFIPQNKHDRNTLDRGKWLITAISFEGEFDKTFPNYKFEHDEKFQSVKNKLISVIEDEISKSDLSPHNKINKYWTRFLNLIRKYDTTIEEKYRLCETHFQNEIGCLVGKFCHDAEIESTATKSFANEYATARNKTAHGNITPIEPIDIVTFRTLQCFIYLLIMERAHVPESQRKQIIAKLF